MKSGFFEKFRFTPAQVKGYLRNAERDLEIARKTDIPEVRFTYSYTAQLSRNT